MRVHGRGGELRAGPRLAARLASFDLARPDERLSGAREWVGTAAVAWRDGFWARGDGVYDLVVPVGAVRWVWRGVAVAWGDGVVTIGGAGAPEVRG